MSANRVSQQPLSSVETPTTDLPRGIVKALQVFKTHFPTLLAKHPGRWAACDGHSLLFVGDAQEPLYSRCLDRGLHEDEFIVLCVLPDATEYID